METAVCPKCGKELNQYELSKLWCTSCNSKFKSVEELFASNPALREAEEIVQNFLVTTSSSLEGYTIDRYYKLLNSEVVLGTGALSELNAAISDLFGDTANKFELKLQEAKKAAVQKIVKQAIEMGSNAVVGFRYEMFAFSNNIISVSAYATAVHVTREE